MFRIGIDVGGTFTDLVAVDDYGNIINIKVPTTPRKPEIGVMKAFKSFLKGNEHKPSTILMVTHATTLATNALFGQLELRLPRIALITTKGFRDIIEIGRQNRPELYNLFFERPKPLVPRRNRYEVDERMGAKGEELKPVRREEVEAIIEQMRTEGIETVAIGFINSHLNPNHELEVKGLIEKLYPKASVITSSEVSPEFREYERLSTTVVNAILMPIVQTYIKSLLKDFMKMRIKAPLYMMQSNGGLAHAKSLASKPAALIESGPASGVIASAFYGSMLGEKHIISFDMGGTTAKAGAVVDGKPEVVMEYEVGGKVHRGRIVKGSGYPVRFPFIDLAECSAGGGTIAWVDEGGALRVGPMSAGADPGPACYGMGGQDPTVTDANLILGRLPETLLAGEMSLNPKLAERAIKMRVAEPLGMNLHEASYSIIRVVNSIMAKILRIVSVERGQDPRMFTLIAFGGAGPMHACALANDLGVSKIIIPPNPGLFSALGLLVSNVRHDFVRAVMKRMNQVKGEDVELTFKEMEAEGIRALRSEGFSDEKIVLIRSVDARYVGQSYEVTISTKPPFTEDVKRLTESFHKRHEALYGYMAEEEPIEIVNVRLTAVGLLEKPKLRRLKYKEHKPIADNLLGFRDVYFDEMGGYVRCPIYSRERLKCGTKICGPLIVEQYDSTTVVHPHWALTVDSYGNLILSKEG